MMESIEEFKKLMYNMQTARRQIVSAILKRGIILQSAWVNTLKSTLNALTDRTLTDDKFQRQIHTANGAFSINIRDEKDVQFLKELLDNADPRYSNQNLADAWLRLDLSSILASFSSVGSVAFMAEVKACNGFLSRYLDANTNGRKPIFITDWDGTMKDYCSQYATNLQPIYSAIDMTKFASRFTRLAAVLTAGPLRGPGILDLTALPLDGPVLISGSWGREWWLGGKRVVHDDGIPEEGFDALERLSDEMRVLLQSPEFSGFALVGSGVQRKVDRLTLGVQTVYGQVDEALSIRYQEAVKERMHRVDPYNQSTKLEVEVCVRSAGGGVWNKADGVDRVVHIKNDSLNIPGRVLISGDTVSDLPMVRQAAAQNPQGVMAMFVNVDASLRNEILELVGDEERCCFISSPDVFHAAVTQLIQERGEKEEQ